MRLRLLIALITSFTLTAPLFAACDWTTTPGNKAKQTCDAVIGTAAEPLSLLHLAGANGASVITFDNTGSQKLRVGGLAGVSNWGAMTLNLRWDGNYFNLDDASKNYPPPGKRK